LASVLAGKRKYEINWKGSVTLKVKNLMEIGAEEQS